tara:strand:+ start:6764 stop:7639 length:876 start_codon:yes stop_codon:yes gene_type:complete
MKKIKIVITGQSNVGKSSMMNYLCDSYVSSVNKKSQTTRVNIQSSVVTDNVNISIYDTPGVSVFDKSLLSVLMKKSFLRPLDKVDALIIILDASKKISHSDKSIIESAEIMKKRVIIVINKIDLLTKNALIKTIDTLKKSYNHPIFSVSVKTADGLQKLINYIKALAKESDHQHEIKTQNDIDAISVQEIIRGEINDLTYGEVPYDCAVIVDKITKSKNLIKIHGIIYVEKINQKKIVIGESGSHIKQIGTNARYKLEDIVSTKIFLDLTVKIKKNWKNDYSFLKNLGYIN